MSSLRERTARDLEAIVRWIPDAAALYRFAGPRLTWPLTSQQLNDIAAVDGATAWVMDDDGTVAGHAQLVRTDDVVRLGRVLIDPAKRGRGLGRELAALAVEQARRQGAARIDLSVLADNQPARRIYDALGFTVVADQEPSDMIAMTHRL